MATPRDMINRALRGLGYLSITKLASGAEETAAFQCLTELMQSLNQQHLWLYDSTRYAHTINANDGDYSWGTAGDITSVPRPDKLQGASYLIGTGTGQLEKPIHVIQTMVEWQNYPLKNLTSTYPSAVFYDPQFPLGLLYFRPIPTGTLSSLLYVWTKIAAFASISTTISLPDGYARALRLLLQCELGPEFNMPVTQEMRDAAAEALGWLKSANMQPRPIGCDVAALGGSGSNYNIIADDYSGQVIKAP